MKKTPKDLHIILASGSPRRKELLAGLNYPFSVKTLETDEVYPQKMDPYDVAVYLAGRKADAFILDNLAENELLLAADTVVIVNGTILNKPSGPIEAKQMLQMLSNRHHLVITGVCMKDRNKKICFEDRTTVYFKNLSEREMDEYIINYQPFDKAGSYGIQEWIGYIAVYKIEGSFYNVMGLPVHRIYEVLQDW